MLYLVILAFLAIIGSRGAALYFMLRRGREGQGPSKRMARALALRVGFSIVLFLCVLLAWKLGYIQPTGIPVGK